MKPERFVDDADDDTCFQIYDDASATATRCPRRAVASTPAPVMSSAADAPRASLRVVAAREIDSAVADKPVARRPIVAARFDVSIPVDREREMLAILAAEPQLGETIELTYKRKEHELAAVFARLSPLEARALYKRLSASRADDALALQFERLIEPRRARLLAFLTEARRREALARARR